MVAKKSTPPQYDVTSYLGRSQYVNSTIDAKTAKRRQESFKRTIGPAAAIGMTAAGAVGGLVGAPILPSIPVVGALAYAAEKGQKRNLKQKQKKAQKKAQRSAERYRLGGAR